uniref:KEN domain-containing protein n=1 Tax=Fagus sylvatica TaxID=28930 RepID=A0A2N9FDM9_FAGSY
MKNGKKGKGKQLNMEIGEPSQKVEPNLKEVEQVQKAQFIHTGCDDSKVELKSPPKPDKIALKCGYPYSLSEDIDFEVALGFCEDKRNYNLVSDFLSQHNIRRHNLQRCAVLTHKKYKTTLEQWLRKKENKDNWCPKYQDWNVKRPKEEARQIIQGILCAVNEFHSNNCFHGFLYHPENYAIHYDEAVIGGDHKKIIRIFLIHENVEVDKCFGVPTINEIQRGKKNDMKALSDVIFTKILRGKPTSCYPEDLKDLHNLFEELQNLEERYWKSNYKHTWKHIVNHPSLWHWKSRFSYIERVWEQYWHANPTLEKDMDIEFTDIDVKNWEQKIPPNAHINKMFHHNNYKSTAVGLLRFLRNVRYHYKDPLYDKKGVLVSEQSDVDYLNEQFIEQKTTEVSELFLVHLYKKICNLDIELEL